MFVETVWCEFIVVFLDAIYCPAQNGVTSQQTLIYST